MEPARATQAMSDKQLLETDGVFVREGVLSQTEIKQLKSDLEKAISAEERYHGSKQYGDYAMVLMCAQYGRSFVELFDNAALMQPFNEGMSPGCIVYAYTSSSMPPDSGNYSVRVHVDSPRIVPGYITNMGATIALDDFTEDNGATWYLPGSQERVDAPSEDYFYANAKRFIAPAGSVLFFNARIWHAGGQNKTPHWRHALTINMCRPYMKQRLDIPRMMAGKDLSWASETALQKLGFHSQVPASYEEYYVTDRALRKYKQPVE